LKKVLTPGVGLCEIDPNTNIYWNQPSEKIGDLGLVVVAGPESRKWWEEEIGNMF